MSIGEDGVPPPLPRRQRGAGELSRRRHVGVERQDLTEDDDFGWPADRAVEQPVGTQPAAYGSQSAIQTTRYRRPEQQRSEVLTVDVAERAAQRMAVIRQRLEDETQPPSAPRRNVEQRQSRPLPAVGAGLVFLLFAGLLGWYVSGSNSGDGNDDTGNAGGGIVAAGQTEDPPEDANLAPLTPAALPAADVPGLVGMELPLTDPYTGTGSTGTAQLYLNSISGQVCHEFDAPAMTGRYRAYLHQAPFPNEGPIVIDLGEVSNSVPLCVASNPIDIARTLADGSAFYIAAHGEDKTFLMRGQLSSAMVAFDNRDPAQVASQEAAIASTTTIGDGSADDLFGIPEEGAYLVVDAGRVSFEGAVPDEPTADRLRAAFVPLLGRGVQVTDNMEIEPGSPPPSGRVIVAGALLFDSGQDQVSGDPEVLATIVDLMTVNPTWKMTITGHTDDVGDWLSNIGLSLRRANNVRSKLSALGVPQERLRVQGAGPEQPIADNQTDEGRARNRRIEISIDS